MSPALFARSRNSYHSPMPLWILSSTGRRDLFFNRDTAVVLAVKIFTFGVLLGALDYVRLRWADPVTVAILVAILGVISMDILAATALREPRTEAIVWGMKWGWRVRVFPIPTYGRLLDQLWNTLVGSTASILATFAAGLVTVGWLAVGIGIWQNETSLWYWGLSGAVTLASGRGVRTLSGAPRGAWS